MKPLIERSSFFIYRDSFVISSNLIHLAENVLIKKIIEPNRFNTYWNLNLFRLVPMLQIRVRCRSFISKHHKDQFFAPFDFKITIVLLLKFYLDIFTNSLRNVTQKKMIQEILTTINRYYKNKMKLSPNIKQNESHYKAHEIG